MTTATLVPRRDAAAVEHGAPAALAGALVAALLTPLASTMIAVALPAIARDLGRDAQSITVWLVSAYLVVGVVGQGAGGRLADRFGYERTVLAGLFVFALGSVLGWTGASLAPLAAGRILMAAGSAVTVPAAMAFLRNGTPIEKRGRAFGAFGSAMGLAASIGPWLAGELVARFGWRAVFVVPLPLIALAAPVLARTFRPRPLRAAARSSGAPDVVGIVLLGAGLLPLAGRGAHGLPALLASAALLACFAAWELRARNPVVGVRLFANAGFGGGAAVVGLHNLAQYALLFQVPIEIERRLGARPEATGRVLLAMLLGMVVSSPVGGRLAERFGARGTALAGSLAGLAGFLMLPAPSALVDATSLVAGVALMGAGLGLASAPAQAAAMSAVDADRAGLAAGTLSTVRYLGGILGVALLSSSGDGSWAPASTFALAASAVASLLLPRGPDRR